MSTSATEQAMAVAVDVRVSGDALSVDLSDGRTLTVPLAWYPRLLHATAAERATWRLVGRGTGVHWTGIEEDISIAGLLAGRPSAENSSSLNRWLESRKS